MSVQVEALAPAERDRLAELEAVVEAGVQTFFEVGLALLEIRDQRYYRQTHGTFDDYCRERWGIGRSHAYRMIDAAQVAELVSPIGDIPNEAQAREFVPLLQDEAELVDVWRELRAEHGDRITAEKVREAVNQRLATGAHVGHATGHNEWYTPAEYADAARRVMGAIDLDPASSVEANEVIHAATYYTAADDGLGREWWGRVWMNPPYAQPLVGEFCRKLAASFGAGVTEACALVNNATETAWFLTLARAASAVCFPSGRVTFWQPGIKAAAPLQGQAVVYLGPQVDLFRVEFGAFGWTASR